MSKRKASSLHEVEFLYFVTSAGKMNCCNPRVELDNGIALLVHQKRKAA